MTETIIPGGKKEETGSRHYWSRCQTDILGDMPRDGAF